MHKIGTKNAIRARDEPPRRGTEAPGLPTGTLTFLFTDIEGSTRLWDTQRESMRSALTRHDALLRDGIESHRGRVVKMAGDSFLAVFATAPDALEAALAIQRALRAEPWPEAAPIRVRIAVHTGDAELRDSDYYGPTLNRAARLLSVGHGGQTLLSEATRDLCRDRLPENASLTTLGEHALKDLARREAIFQLCHPDLAQTFPALKILLPEIDESTPSIAVLPFADLSPERDQEYFADGLAEELVTVLSKVRGLRVTSRTSAFSFKGKDVDIPTIAKKLNVATILEGSVRKSGKRVRITAQLIRVATDSHLWSEIYDRELEDIFAVQHDIAHEVVKNLRLALMEGKPDAAAADAVNAELAVAAKGRTGNTEAHRLYLYGRFLIERLTREDAAQGIEYLKQALALDPRYALAWAGLAGAYSNQAGYGWAPLAPTFDLARSAARSALELEPDLAEGHAELGWIRMAYDWDWAGADACYVRAMELAPGSRGIVGGASLLADNLGRTEDAIALAERAVAIDPLSVSAQASLGLRCLNAGLLDQAETALQRALKLSPENGLVRWAQGVLRLEQSRPDDALAAFEREELQSLRLLGRTLAHHARGRPAESDAALQELIDTASEDSAFQIAEAYAYRGETDLAFEWLERAHAQHDPGLSQMKPFPLLRNLHGDRRWQPFLEKMGFG